MFEVAVSERNGATVCQLAGDLESSAVSSLINASNRPGNSTGVVTFALTRTKTKAPANPPPANHVPRAAHPSRQSASAVFAGKIEQRFRPQCQPPLRPSRLCER